LLVFFWCLLGSHEVKVSALSVRHKVYDGNPA